MNKHRFAIGTVIGAVAGVVTGMLTAPKSGYETREELKAKAVKLKEEAERRAQAGNDSKRPIDSIKKQAKDVLLRKK